MAHFNPECKSCADALINPESGLFHKGCQGCEARALAHSPQFSNASRSNAITPEYRSALQTSAGSEWRELHENVKLWAEAIESHRKSKS